MGAGEQGSSFVSFVFFDAFLVTLLGQCTFHVFAFAQIFTVLFQILLIGQISCNT